MNDSPDLAGVGRTLAWREQSAPPERKETFWHWIDRVVALATSVATTVQYDFIARTQLAWGEHFVKVLASSKLCCRHTESEE